jgi:hypothetical protein
MHTMLLQSYNESPRTWDQFCSQQYAQDFRVQHIVRPSAIPNLSKLGRDGEVRTQILTQETYLTWQADTFAARVAVSRSDMIDDQIGYISTQTVPNLGRAAARAVSDLVYKTILGNAGSFFGSGNGNYQSGGSSPLASASLTVAFTAMLGRKDSESNNIDTVPKTLVVPPELRETALGLLESEYIARITASDGQLPTGNPWKNSLNLAVEPRISNSKFTGHSATAWYLFCMPALAPFIVGYVGKAGGPIIEQFPVNLHEANLLHSWRAILDFGVAFGDPNAAYLSAGA